MKILLNEKWVECSETSLTVATLVERYRPDADILVVNGYPAELTTSVTDEDQVVLFTRGDQPSPEELDSLLSARHTPGVAQTLLNGTVGILGLGGLGSTIAVALARVGIGKLVLCDFDVVEPTNLNRQQYFIDQLGQLKTEALAQTLHRIRPHLSLTLESLEATEDNVASLFEGCDVICEALDKAERKVCLIEELQTKLPTIPVVAGSGMAGFGPSNLIVTEGSGTLYVCGDQSSEARPGSGLMAPRVGIAAHHQANQVLRLLLNETALL